jgi:hypothetical protein
MRDVAVDAALVFMAFEPGAFADSFSDLPIV